MTTLSISVQDIGFKPIGGDTGGTPESVLHGQLSIAGLPCHAQAYQVNRAEDGTLTAVNKDYADTLEALYELSGFSLMTTEIDGRDYVITVYPHSN